jgi:hypothetical protein
MYTGRRLEAGDRVKPGAGVQTNTVEMTWDLLLIL